MPVYLGEVDVITGVVRFQSHDVQQCRVFLNEHGLDCTYEGWISDDKCGAIYFNGTGQGWTAAYWYRTDNQRVA